MSEIRLPTLLSKVDLVRLPVHEREHYVKESIRKTLGLNPNGVTAKQLAKLLEFDSRAIDKHLAVMLHTNEVYTVQYDQTLIYFLNGRTMHPLMQSSFPLGDNKSIEVFQLRNRLGEYVYLQAKESTDYRSDTGAGVLIPLDKFPEFVEYLKQTLKEMVKMK